MAKNAEKFGELFTELEILPFRFKKGHFGFGSLVCGNSFRLSNIGIHSDLQSKSLRLTYPIKKLSDGKSIPIFYPINQAVDAYLREQFFKKYCDLCGEDAFDDTETTNGTDREEK